MNENFDIKEIERKAYFNYHKDGIVDIFLGMSIAIFTISFFDPYITFMIALLPIFYRDAKRRYTFPRLGYVKFDEQTGVSGRTIKLATSLAALLFIVGLLVFFSRFPDNYEWLNPLVENWELTAGVIGLLTLSLFGYTSKVRRFYYYAGISFILFIASFLISVQGYYVLPVLGGIVALNGFFHLYTFTQEYPLRQRRKND